MKVQEVITEERNPNMTYSAWLKFFNFKKKWYQAKGTDKAKRDLQKWIDDYPEHYEEYKTRMNTPRKSDDELRRSGGYRWTNPNARDF